MVLLRIEPETEQTRGIKEATNEAVTRVPPGISPAITGKLMLDRIKNYEAALLLYNNTTETSVWKEGAAQEREREREKSSAGGAHYFSPLQQFLIPAPNRIHPFSLVHAVGVYAERASCWCQLHLFFLPHPPDPSEKPRSPL